LEDVLWLIHHSKFSCISNALGEKLGKSWGKIRNFFGQNGEKMVKTADLAQTWLNFQFFTNWLL
jgi:hypothetical protein